jgi:hypothetical protein
LGNAPAQDRHLLQEEQENNVTELTQVQAQSTQLASVLVIARQFSSVAR